jgi:molecular chaperone DnaK
VIETGGVMGAVVGIDLGTTYSAIARVNEAGLPEIIPNSEGDKITPSVVLFEGNTAIIGSIAKEALATDPESVVQLVKRQMGSTWTFMHQGIELRPEQISALILKKLVKDAADVIGPIDQAVITVPAYFNDAMRNATKMAGEMAGLDVLALINEPTAAAIAFSLEKRIEDALVVICDLGGGTFDVTIMTVAGGELKVRATGGDNFLGGANFDKKLYDYFVSCFQRQFGIDLDDPYQVDLAELARIAQEWLRKAERLKRDLTLRDHASAGLSAMGRTLRVEVTAEQYRDMSQVLLSEIEERIRATLSDAGIRPEDPDIVLLVGGATRMPMVRSLVTRVFRKAPNTSVNPDEAVALGASLFGANRALNRGNDIDMPDNRRSYLTKLSVADVASHSLGVQAYDRPPHLGGKLYNAIILKRNVSLPFDGSDVFFTSKPGQTVITIDVLEGEDPDIDLCVNIGRLMISDLPLGRPAGLPVVVTMRYNENGILEVEATDQETGRAARTTITRSTALSEEESRVATAVVKQVAVE